MKRSSLCVLVFGLLLVCGCSDKGNAAFKRGVSAVRRASSIRPLQTTPRPSGLNPNFAEAYCGPRSAS